MLSLGRQSRSKSTTSNCLIMSFKQNNADFQGRLHVLSSLLLVILCCSLKLPVLVVASSMTRTFTSDFSSLNHVPWVGYNTPSKRIGDTQSVHQGQMLHETTIYMDEDEDERAYRRSFGTFLQTSQMKRIFL